MSIAPRSFKYIIIFVFKLVKKQLYCNPILVFQIAVAVRHHDYTANSLHLILLAWLSGSFFYAMIIREIEHSARWQVIRFLKRFELCRFTPIDLSAAVNSDIMEAYIRSALAFPEDLGRRESSVRREVLRRTRIYFVERGKATEKPCPTAFSTFIGGYIFLTEKIEKMGNIQRFFLLHELGHLSMFKTLISAHEISTVSPFFLVLFWAGSQIFSTGNISFAALMLVTIFAEALVLLRDSVWVITQNYGRVHDEMEADRFALTQLSQAARHEVAEFFLRYPNILRDVSLDNFQNKVRIDMLTRNLNQVRSSKMFEFMDYKQPLNTEVQMFICYFVSAMLVLYTHKPSIVDVHILFLVSVIVVVVFSVLTFASRTLNGVITTILERPSSIPFALVKEWPEEPKWLVEFREALGIGVRL